LIRCLDTFVLVSALTNEAGTAKVRLWLTALAAGSCQSARGRFSTGGDKTSHPA